ncbi:hypothetical protein [Parasitella parasitica]|uniref:Uncharacterized protein n=1 Tax=Parasitella parasitica TaxID=35722 RepID=A0A0B7MY94_9FUNG|nr:hypothetical protein [Parasitella parasitica]
MVELSVKNKRFPRLNLIHRNCHKKEELKQLPSLGSGVNLYNNTVSHSIVRNHSNDPYMPHIARNQSASSSSLARPSRLPQYPMRYHASVSSPNLPPPRSMPDPNATFVYNSPPMSPPPLSPTNLSFATSSRPSWRDLNRSPTYQPASSLSSTDDDDQDQSDDDDNAPLGLMLSSSPFDYGKPFSLLSDLDEDGDDDLVPIARLSLSRESVHHMTAAEKYKQKVMAKLQMNIHPNTYFN